jgi:hypothetical protein
MLFLGWSFSGLLVLMLAVSDLHRLGSTYDLRQGGDLRLFRIDGHGLST